MIHAALLKYLFIGVFISLGVNNLFADDTPVAEIASQNTNDVSVGDALRAYLQIREEIQATQLVLERGQQDAQAAIRRTLEDMGARFQLLEQTLSAQRADEFKAIQKMNHFVLVAAGAFVAVVFLALLFTSYFQWRVANRLAELSSVRPTLLTMANSRALSDGGQAVMSQNVEQANTRLLGVVEQLQRRIFELEKVAHGSMKEEVEPVETHAGQR